MMSKIISIWSEENSLERIVICLTNSMNEDLDNENSHNCTAVER